MNAKTTNLSKDFLERQRSRLIALRAALGDTRTAREDEEHAIQAESGGRAAEYEDDAQKLAMLELDENLANRATTRRTYVERALQKIEEGTYGVSDASGKPIQLERLEAVPEAIYTLAEQQAREPAV
jgi:DnaK suppressor protein